MSGNLNRCTFIGRLGRDPETKYTGNGDAVTTFSIAVSETWKDKNSGEKKEQTEWVRIVMYRKLAEIAAQYLTKGTLVYLEGKLHTRQYDKAGETRYVTEVVCDEMQMLSGRSHGGNPDDGDAQEQQHRTRPQPASRRDAWVDDAIPF